MTRPDPAAFVPAGLLAAGAAVFALNGWYIPAGIIGGCALGMLLLFWRVADGDDIEALVKATRENMPEVIYVPDEWVKECGL